MTLSAAEHVLMNEAIAAGYFGNNPTKQYGRFYPVQAADISAPAALGDEGTRAVLREYQADGIKFLTAQVGTIQAKLTALQAVTISPTPPTA